MDILEHRLQALFEAQKSHQYIAGKSSVKARIKTLTRLQKALETTYRKRIQEALFADFRKPPIETDLTEIYPVVSEIKHVKKNLSRWMDKHPVATPLALSGTSSYYRYEPKGVCLIIAPWNFPVNLTFGPLVSANAAGNTVFLKPSEITPNCSALMATIIRDVFPENEVVLAEGGTEVSKALLKLPFNHIFFTGSPQVGKLIMKAAAEHLSTITLELGGKSPVIVDETANLKAAAKKIVWGKFLNSGQICVSPDYLLVADSVREALIREMKAQLIRFYSESPSASSSYSRIVNARHYKRLAAHLEDAKMKGAKVLHGGMYDPKQNYMAPTLVSNLPETASLMQDEIFGPILPILNFHTIEEAIERIKQYEKPLALYIYSKNRKTISRILEQTRAGSSCINTNVLQYTNPHLPFGGINNSGIGKSHGFYGFQAFSNQRSVLTQHRFTAMELLFPPYNHWKQKLADLTLKWL